MGQINSRGYIQQGASQNYKECCQEMYQINRAQVLDFKEVDNCR